MQSFQTNFKFNNGAAKVKETGLSSTRETDYTIQRSKDEYKIFTYYDETKVSKYHPGSTASRDNSMLEVKTFTLVDGKGFIKSYHDQSRVFAGSQKRISKKGPDVSHYGFSKISFVKEFPRKDAGSSDVGKLQSLHMKMAVAKSSKKKKSKRELNESALEILKLLDLLAADPKNRVASKNLNELTMLHPEVAVPIITKHIDSKQVPMILSDLSQNSSHDRFEKRDWQFGSSESIQDHLKMIAPNLIALAFSGAENAQLYLLSLIEKNDVKESMARIVLNLVPSSSLNVLGKLEHLTFIDPTNMLTLGKHLSFHSIDHTRSIFAHRLLPNVTSSADNLLQVVHALANTGENSRAFIKELIDIVHGRGPFSKFIDQEIRLAAVKSLKESSKYPEVRAALANTFLELNGQPVVQLEIIDTATRGIRNKGRIREDEMDMLDMIFLSKLHYLESNDSLHQSKKDNVKSYDREFRQYIRKYVQNRFREKSTWSPFDGLHKADDHISLQNSDIDEIDGPEYFYESNSSPIYHIPLSYSSAGVTNTGNMTLITRRSILDTDKDWTSTKSPAFDIVSRLSDRQADVKKWPHHLSYLIGKYVGWDKLHFEIGAGFFGGVDEAKCKPNSLMTASRARATVTAFGKSFDVVDIGHYIIHSKSPSNKQGRAYAKFFGTMLTKDKQLDFTCQSIVTTLLDFTDKTISQISFKLYILIAYVELEISLKGGLKVETNFILCENPAVDVDLKFTVYGGVEGFGRAGILFAGGGVGLSGLVSYT